MQLVQKQITGGDVDVEKVINSSSLRSSLSPVLDGVQFNHDNYIIERKGKPAAAIVPLFVYEEWKRNQERFFEIVREIQQANQDADPDEVLEFVLEAQQAVRNELTQAD